MRRVADVADVARLAAVAEGFVAGYIMIQQRLAAGAGPK